MVRAAATGVFNYEGADPTNKHWRIKHRLIINELLNQEDKFLLERVHDHWLGYVAHGGLEKESFERVKDHATSTLKKIKLSVFPWSDREEAKGQNATIKPADADLISRYRAAMQKG
jgi:hypothetical protein